jgi:hypothetical protein
VVPSVDGLEAIMAQNNIKSNDWDALLLRSEELVKQVRENTVATMRNGYS